MPGYEAFSIGLIYIIKWYNIFRRGAAMHYTPYTPCILEIIGDPSLQLGCTCVPMYFGKDPWISLFFLFFFPW